MAEPFRGVVNVDRSMPPRTCQRATTSFCRPHATAKARSRSSRAPSRWPVMSCASGATAARPYVDLERQAAALILRG
jgi:hypothetical protein